MPKKLTKEVESKDCLSCQHEPDWQKIYDDIHDAFCTHANKVVDYGAPTHGETDEYCSEIMCSHWQEYDGKTELRGRTHRESLKKLNKYI